MPTCSPCLGWLVIKYWKQKDVGVQLSAAYLADWAFAMPFYQDKQLSQPTPAYYIGVCSREPEMAPAFRHTDIIHPT